MINTAGYHPSALESFSYTLPLISAALRTMEIILYTGQAESQQMQSPIYCVPLVELLGKQEHFYLHAFDQQYIQHLFTKPMILVNSIIF